MYKSDDDDDDDDDDAAHQPQKGHTVPKQVIMIATSIQSLQSKNCTV